MEAVIAAIVGGLVGGGSVQLLNTWKIWSKIDSILLRLDQIEEDLGQIGGFRLKRDITGGKAS